MNFCSFADDEDFFEAFTPPEQENNSLQDDQTPRKKKKKSQKAYDCIEAMNIVLKRRFGEVSVDPSQDCDEEGQPRDSKPMYEITVKEIKRVMALKKVKNFQDFKANVLNYFKMGKDCSLALKIFDVPDAFENPAPKQEAQDQKKEDKFPEESTEEAKPKNEDPSDNASQVQSQEDKKDEDKSGEDPQAPVGEEKDNIWAEAEHEFDVITEKAKEELQEVLRNARLKAAHTKKLMREAAEAAVARKMASHPDFRHSEYINMIASGRGAKLSRYMRKKLLKQYREKTRVQVLIKNDNIDRFRENLLKPPPPPVHQTEEETVQGEKEEKEDEQKCDNNVQVSEETEDACYDNSMPGEKEESEFEDSDEESLVSSEEEDLGEPVDITKFLELQTFHGHEMEEGEPEEPCSGIPFDEPVSTYKTVAYQLKSE